MTIRVLIADDHKLVRAGLAMLIAEIPGYEVVGEAGDGVDALSQAKALQPDVILLDIQMPGLSGLDCLAQIKASPMGCRVLMLSMHANEEHVRQAFELGAMGYLLKDATPNELELAFKTVLSGNIWLSAMLTPQLVGGASAKNDHDQNSELTPRQQVVLKRLAEGASVKTIAYELELSVKTIETYRAQIMERLGLNDVPALVRYAIRQGIIQL